MRAATELIEAWSGEGPEPDSRINFLRRIHISPMPDSPGLHPVIGTLSHAPHVALLYL